MIASMAPERSIEVLVVDDEPLARRNLRLLLARDPAICAVTECGSGAEAITAIRQSKPDLAFLDVQMPECDGFDVLEALGCEAPASIIFVTAYDEYAVRAFEAGAIDYLLKPFDDARFRRSLDRAKDRITLCRRFGKPPLERLVIKSTGRLVVLDVADIDWIEAANYYACLHAGNRTHIVRRTLKDFEQDLDADTFVRIHRSIIVNLARITGLELQSDGEYDVILGSKARLRLSRRYRTRLQERLKMLG